MVTAGEVLKRKRESLGKSLDTISLDTKIQKRFLSYIEKNEFHRFESEVFLTGFIKIYSEELKLDTNKVLALYRRSNPQGLPKGKEKDVKRKKNRKGQGKISKLLTPRNITTILVTLFILSVLTYIGVQIYKFQSPPELNILEPVSESTVTTETATVKGSTHPEAVLEVNEKLITVEEDGTFETEVTLNSGINTITVKARKNSNNILETVETVKIIYKKPETTEVEEPTEEETPNSVRLEIFDTSAWIKLDIDKVNKIAQIVPPSKQEYEIKKELSLTTGRVSNTALFFNNELIEWPNPLDSGVVEISCTVENKTITCK
jgi:cytoskeletal protein RodZ